VEKILLVRPLVISWWQWQLTPHWGG
jgi:hypothetical protein